MHELITLDLVDAEGAVREGLDGGGTRRDMFRRLTKGGAVLAGGGLLIGGLPAVALASPSASQDVKILNFALLLEYLESSFYVEAVKKGKLSGSTLHFAKVVRDHELAHVAFIKQALGGKAIKKPSFDFKGTTSDPDKFRATAMALEDTGVSAYNGQGTRLTRKTLGAAAEIVSVEARHAAWIRYILNTRPAPVAFDEALSMKAVKQRVAATGFVK
jgi:hypothetical protein